MEVLQDPGMQQFIKAEQQKQKFKETVNQLTEECFDRCIDKPSNHFASSTQSCVEKCVLRFIDTSNFVVNRLERTHLMSAGSSESSFE